MYPHTVHYSCVFWLLWGSEHRLAKKSQNAPPHLLLRLLGMLRSVRPSCWLTYILLIMLSSVLPSTDDTSTPPSSSQVDSFTDERYLHTGTTTGHCLSKVGPLSIWCCCSWIDRSSKFNFQVCALRTHLNLVSWDFALFLEHEPFISSVLSELWDVMWCDVMLGSMDWWCVGDERPTDRLTVVQQSYVS